MEKIKKGIMKNSVSTPPHQGVSHLDAWNDSRRSSECLRTPFLSATRSRGRHILLSSRESGDFFVSTLNRGSSQFRILGCVLLFSGGNGS